MIKRYCRTVKKGQVCGRPLPSDRYFNCKKCVQDLPEDTEYVGMPDHDIFDIEKTPQEMKSKKLSGKKRCNKCGKVKAKSKFHKQNQVYGCGLRPNCKDCYIVIQKEYRAKRKESHDLNSV